MLVLHGDQFDRAILKGPLSEWGDRLYDMLMDWFGGHTPPQVKIDGKIKRFSLAKSLSKHGQWALHLLNNFENAVYKLVKKRDCDGLICGHTHIPVIKPIKDILYANCGSWLKSGHTALIETQYGDLQLIDWPASHETSQSFNPFLQQEPKNVSLHPDLKSHRRITLSIQQSIRRLWPEKELRNASSLEWIEIKKRDEIVMKRYGGLQSEPLCTPVYLKQHAEDTPIKLKTPHTSATLITCRPDIHWKEELQKPLHLYEAFISPHNVGLEQSEKYA